MSEEMVFDSLTLAEIPVTVAGTRYILREGTEADICKWRNSQTRNARIDPETKLGTLGDIADSAPLLVSLCLCETEDGHIKTDKRGNPLTVPLATIKSWPARIVSALHARAMEISGLNEKETADVLEKRLADTQKKLDALRATDAVAGNGQGPNSTA